MKKELVSVALTALIIIFIVAFQIIGCKNIINPKPADVTSDVSATARLSFTEGHHFPGITRNFLLVLTFNTNNIL